MPRCPYDKALLDDLLDGAPLDIAPDGCLDRFPGCHAVSVEWERDRMSVSWKFPGEWNNTEPLWELLARLGPPDGIFFDRIDTEDRP